ncbi:pentapeptide repeat-containing protein [Azorhizobium sp. AG788]|uniref:pentapeptide repeat-containing protein n=1 Tax=Azorhizobium sp. AG788 TaxID=2183897 RepID=UPI003139D0EB
MAGADLAGADLAGADLAGADLAEATLATGAVTGAAAGTFTEASAAGVFAVRALTEARGAGDLRMATGRVLACRSGASTGARSYNYLQVDLLTT